MNFPLAVTTYNSRLFRIDLLEYTGAEFQANRKQGLNEAEYDAGVAGRNCRRGGVERVGLLIQTRLTPFYEAMQKQGLFLKESRYPFFVGQWILLVFVMSILIAYLYAWSRATAGAGPKTALKIGMIVGFCAGMPGNFAQAAWSPVPRMLPLGWMLEMWVGAILAAVVAGFLYKE